MELSPTQYAQQQLRKGKTPKQVLNLLRESDYDCEDAYEIVQHARAHRAWKKAAYIAVLAVIIPLIAYAVVTSNAQPQQQPGISAQNITSFAAEQQNPNICDLLRGEQRQSCIKQALPQQTPSARNSSADIPDLNQSALYEQAIQLQDPNYCEALNEPTRSECLNEVLATPPSYG